MNRGHAGRVRASRGALFDLAHRFFKRADRRIAVTRVNVALLLAGEDLIGLFHRVVSKRRAGVDRGHDGLACGRWLAFAGVYELRCDVALLWLVCHQRYLTPPSQSTVTTIAGGRRDAASLQAANTFAPELGPTNNPSSRANLLVINNASSVDTSSVSEAKE